MQSKINITSKISNLENLTLKIYQYIFWSESRGITVDKNAFLDHRFPVFHYLCTCNSQLLHYVVIIQLI